MARMITKIFHRPDDLNQAITELKTMGCKPLIIDSSADIIKALADACLSEQALDYYQIGIATGGRIVAVSVDDTRMDEVNKLLLSVGADRLREKVDQKSTSPGFAKAKRMSATNPIDAQMTGDFRKY